MTPVRYRRTLCAGTTAENAAATQVALCADDIADLNAAAARIGFHRNRYSDLHMGLAGR